VTQPMLSIEELSKANINIDVAREAYEHASARLADVLDSKKVLEQKAQTFFAAYVTVALALLGTAGSIVAEGGSSLFSCGLAVSGLCFVVGAGCCAFAQIDKYYAGMGSAPKQWLYRGAIDGPSDGLPKLLAYLTWHRQTEIDRSAELNAQKARLIRYAIAAGIAAPVFLLAFVIASLPIVDHPSEPSPAAAEAGVEAEGAVVD